MTKLVFKDRGTSLLVLSMIVVLYAFICMTKYTFSSAMVYIVDEGYMTKFQTGVIVSAFWASYAITQVFGGFAADRWNPKGLITIGLVGSALANLAVYFCYDNYVAPFKKRTCCAVAELVYFIIYHRVLFDVHVFARDICLGLIVIVI